MRRFPTGVVVSAVSFFLAKCEIFSWEKTNLPDGSY